MTGGIPEPRIDSVKDQEDDVEALHVFSGLLLAYMCLNLDYLPTFETSCDCLTTCHFIERSGRKLLSNRIMILSILRKL